MSTETIVKTIEDDSNSLYKVQKIRFSSDKSLYTPTKTIPLDRIKLMHTLNPRSRQLNEIFKRFNANMISEANENNDKFNQLEVWFNSQKNKITEKNSTLCILDFNEKRIPTSDELEFLTDLAYCNSDITTIPTINHFNTPKQTEISYEDYKNYLKLAIEKIEQLNHKSIMGVIPKLAPKKVEDLVTFYHNEGINAFALDLAGSNPISASLRIFKVLKILNKLDLLGTSYIHGHNVGMRVNKAENIIPAKDVLGFGVGIGSLGEKRTIFHPNRAFLEFIKINPMNKFRLFDKTNYGYVKGIAVSEVEKIYPKDCSIPINVLKKSNQNAASISYLQKIFNMEQLALESHRIREIINESPDDSLEYIREKKYTLPDDIKLIEKGKNKIK